MTETYTAWDGERYPWPPPEHWYLAADGRWWHPNSGPDVVGPAGTDSAAKGAPPGRYGSGDGPPSTVEPDGAGPKAVPPTAGRTDGRATWWPLLIGLPLAALLGAVAAVVLLRAASPGEAGSSSTDEATPTASPVDSSTDPDPEGQAPAAPQSAATSSILERDPGQLVAEFRTVLEDHDLTSGSLSDEEILTFGSTLCVFAASAEEPGDFEALRELAIDDTESDLSDVELSVAISAAIIVFCPLDAERLEIAL